MRKLLILENNKEDTYKVNIGTMKSTIEGMGFTLREMPHEPNEGKRKKTSDVPEEDIGYIGTNQEGWEICLRRIHIPSDYGEDFFISKLNRIMERYKPDCVLCHLSLFKRDSSFFLEYPSVKGLMPYAERGIKVAVYTGCCDDKEQAAAEADGKIDYCYNKRNLEMQTKIIKDIMEDKPVGEAV